MLTPSKKYPLIMGMLVESNLTTNGVITITSGSSEKTTLKPTVEIDNARHERARAYSLSSTSSSTSKKIKKINRSSVKLPPVNKSKKDPILKST